MKVFDASDRSSVESDLDLTEIMSSGDNRTSEIFDCMFTNDDVSVTEENGRWS
jgi:hypothetical protein